MFKRIDSKKGVEMTLPIIVTIVLCLVLLAILIYMLTSRTKLFAASTSCDESLCKTSGESCPENHRAGFVACSETVDEKRKTGTCCVPSGGQS